MTENYGPNHCDECTEFYVWKEKHLEECDKCEPDYGYKCLHYRWSIPHSVY